MLLQSGSFRAVSCFYLSRGSLFAAYLPALCWFAWFHAASCLCLLRGWSWRLLACSRWVCWFRALGARTCFVAGSWRLPACSLWVCLFCAVWCLYLLRGWFWVACLPVVGGLARSPAVFCLHLPSWLGFGSLACLRFVAWLVPCRFVLACLFPGSVLPLVCVLLCGLACFIPCQRREDRRKKAQEEKGGKDGRRGFSVQSPIGIKLSSFQNRRKVRSKKSNFLDFAVDTLNPQYHAGFAAGASPGKSKNSLFLPFLLATAGLKMDTGIQGSEDQGSTESRFRT